MLAIKRILVRFVIAVNSALYVIMQFVQAGEPSIMGLLGPCQPGFMLLGNPCQVCFVLPI